MLQIKFKAAQLYYLYKTLNTDAARFISIMNKVRDELRTLKPQNADDEITITTDAKSIVDMYEYLSYFADGKISDFNESIYATLATQIQAGVMGEMQVSKEGDPEGEWMQIYEGITAIRSNYEQLYKQDIEIGKSMIFG